MKRHGILDLWQGRREKPLVAGKPRAKGGFNEQAIHEMRMREMREAEELSNRHKLMPHLRRPLPKEPDPAPVKAAKPKDTIFRPLKSEEPSLPVEKAPIAEDSSPVGKRKMTPMDGGLMKHHERPNHIEAEARKAETAKMTRAELSERKRRAKKKKLMPRIK